MFLRFKILSLVISVALAFGFTPGLAQNSQDWLNSAREWTVELSRIEVEVDRFLVSSAPASLESDFRFDIHDLPATTQSAIIRAGIEAILLRTDGEAHADVAIEVVSQTRLRTDYAHFNQLAAMVKALKAGGAVLSLVREGVTVGTYQDKLEIHDLWLEVESLWGMFQ